MLLSLSSTHKINKKDNLNLANFWAISLDCLCPVLCSIPSGHCTGGAICAVIGC